MTHFTPHLQPDGDRPKTPVIVEHAGSIDWVTLSRPEKANALNRAMVEALLSALDAAERRPEARAIVFQGAGRNFCAGADLFELLKGGPEGIRALMDPLRAFLLRLERSHLATIAAVHGAARAGGLEIALACDAVVAADSATFGDAHLAHSLLPAGGATARLPRAVGWQRAKWLILSAACIGASKAQEWGLVLEVVNGTELRTSAQRVASSLSEADRATFSEAKQLLAAVSEQPFSTSLEAEIVTLENHARSEAFQTGVSQFLKRKSPP